MENSDLLSAQANLVQEVVATITKQGDAITQNVETPLNTIVSNRPAIWTGNGGDAFDSLISAEIGPGLEAILGQIKNLSLTDFCGTRYGNSGGPAGVKPGQ